MKYLGERRQSCDKTRFGSKFEKFLGSRGCGANLQTAVIHLHGVDDAPKKLVFQAASSLYGSRSRVIWGSKDQNICELGGFIRRPHFRRGADGGGLLLEFVLVTRMREKKLVSFRCPMLA